MKISHLQEDSEASMPAPGQPSMRSARDPKVLETSAGATGSGSVATVSSPIGATISRNSSIYGKTPKGSMLKGIKTSKKYANSTHVSESHIPLNKIDPPDHGEPEGDFVKNQLHTIKRVTTHLERIIGNNEDLPEWVEMKVSQAQGMMVAIMGYMISSKERELEHETGEEGVMAEDKLNELSPAILQNYKTKRQSEINSIKANNPDLERGTKPWINVAVKANGIRMANKSLKKQGVSEDEQLDGMALGELKAIVQDTKKIYQCVKNGTPLEAWMYKKITNSNESLTAVAQQIDNPAIREPEGVAEAAPNPKHLQRYGHEADQIWPDDSNSLSKRYNDRDIVVPNLGAVYAGTAAPNKHYQYTPFRTNGVKIATKIKPSITKTSVKRKDSNRPVPSFLQKGVAEGFEEDDECHYCRGTGEGQFDGTSCSHCHGSGVNPPQHDDDDFDEPWDHGIFEDVIDEEVLAKKLAKQLELFKRGINKDLSGKPKAKDLGKKPVYSNTLESKSKGSLPGAVPGIKIMSPEEFTKSVDDEELDEGAFTNGITKLKNYVLSILGKKTGIDKNQEAFQRMMHNIITPVDSTQYDRLWQEYKSNKQYYVPTPSIQHDLNNKEKMYLWSNSIVQFIMNRFPSANPEALAKVVGGLTQLGAKEAIAIRHKDMGIDDKEVDENTNFMSLKSPMKMNDYVKQADILHSKMMDASRKHDTEAWERLKKQYEELEALAKKGMIPEATKLSAPQRDFGDEEFQDYMKRTVGTPDIDKKTGQVKVDKKGKEKYVSGKLKTDKYKLPYIHRSSAIKYYSPEGKRYDPEQVKDVLKQRPKKLLKQNEKMKHSNGELEQFFNIGFAALVGIALDETTNNLIIVNTCPGAGSCQIDCFAMGGGKIQYEAPWQSDGRILTYLLNDPDGFFNQLSSEIKKEESDGKKGGYKVSIRWHDAGDFFSPEYMDLAFKLASKFPDVDFYAYTKMAGAALGDKPKNFIINWSEGAHTSQEKQVKANDPNLEKTKNSRIVPDELFQDLLVKNEKGNLIKGETGQWQVVPEKLPELKQRLASEYGVSANSILSYDEWEQKTNRGKKEVPVKYNVIVAPGEPDLSANSHGVLGTLLLKH